MANPERAEKNSDPIPLMVAEIFHLSHLFRRWGAMAAKTIGETQSRWQVLSAASTDDKTVAHVARRLGVSRQNVQRVADGMVEDKLARWAANPNHRKSSILQLTRKGRSKFDELMRVAAKYHRQLAEGIEPEQIETARFVLEKFRLQTDRDVRHPETFLQNP